MQTKAKAVRIWDRFGLVVIVSMLFVLSGAPTTGVQADTTSMWYIKDQRSVAWGIDGDIPAPGDYDGNRTTDVAVFRPSTGTWCVENQAPVGFGTAEDIPIPGDYDGNQDPYHTTDIAVYRPSTGVWYVLGQFSVEFGGLSKDVPVPADYDGNGSADVAIFRSGMWYVKDQLAVAFEMAGDIPVPGDYNGDGAA